ncbi:hypothetical protein [Micromonospora sp. CPCC 205561]|uniref:hypothetical protein n=1 Tax=Micromonospora sp. CPCC 205561 TaxID=3122407 RepID=UPI002FF16F0D
MDSSAATFRSDLPVVDMVRRSPDVPHRWLLWPAWQYRVCAPLADQDELNLFQRGVLGLCRVGVRDTEEMAAALRLHPALVRVVVGELARFGYLDEIRRVTEAGREALVTGEVDPQDTQVAYVFQDVFSQTLWPGAEVAPRYADVSWDQSGPFLRSGSKGKPGPPRRLVPVRLPDGLTPQPPDAVTILDAARRRRLRRPDGQAPGAAIRRVSIVDSAPTMVWLSTCLYVNRQGGEEVWQARDPFAPRASPLLRSFVVSRTDHDLGLKQVLADLTGGTAEKRAVDLYAADLDVRRDVEEQLALGLGLRAADDPELCRLMVAVEAAYLRSGEGRGRAANEHTVTYAARTVELLLRRMVAGHRPPDPVLGELRRNETLRRKALAEVCRSVGFGPPGRLARVPWQKVEEAFAGDGHVNRHVLLAAALLSVLAGRPGHPLLRFGQRQPGFIDAWNLLGDLRNDGSHAAISDPAPDEVEWARGLAHDMVRACLGAPPVSTSEGTPV